MLDRARKNLHCTFYRDMTKVGAPDLTSGVIAREFFILGHLWQPQT